ncbi:hypothetical protein BTVI_18104 [Pitangus sulphuratus]|nr:hypothetical protein BTVI_18104 [Pitangus sulphuratus]
MEGEAEPVVPPPQNPPVRPGGDAPRMKSSDIDQELFTESYCKVCSAQLISESQRVAHYEVGRSRLAALSQFRSENSGFEELFLLVASYSASDVTAAVSAACLAFPSAQICQVRLRFKQD